MDLPFMGISMLCCISFLDEEAVLGILTKSIVAARSIGERDERTVYDIMAISTMLWRLVLCRRLAMK